jgi:hypothetical protein
MITHKYVHTTDEVVPYVSHKYNLDLADPAKLKKDKVYESLKKQSFTLLNYLLKSPVFGLHDDSRMLVGMLFDQAHCLPAKGFFKYDKGTYDRKWVGTKESVEAYLAAMRKDNVIMRNLDDMRRFVKLNPNVLTEVLARVTRESALAIIIAKDTPEALTEAKRRAEILATDVGIVVPIVFYNPKLQSVTVYSEYPLLKCAMCKDELFSLLKKSNSDGPQLFKSSEPSDQLNKKIDALIIDAENQEKAKPEIWITQLAAAKELLNPSVKIEVVSVDKEEKSVLRKTPKNK